MVRLDPMDGNLQTQDKGRGNSASQKGRNDRRGNKGYGQENRSTRQRGKRGRGSTSELRRRYDLLRSPSMYLYTYRRSVNISFVSTCTYRYPTWDMGSVENEVFYLKYTNVVLISDYVYKY